MNQLGLSVLIWNAKRIDITLCKERRKTHRHPVSVCTVLSRTALWVGEMSTDAAQCWTSSWAYIYWACTPEDSVKFNFKHISHKAKASLWASVNFRPEGCILPRWLFYMKLLQINWIFIWYTPNNPELCGFWVIFDYLTLIFFFFNF